MTTKRSFYVHATADPVARLADALLAGIDRDPEQPHYREDSFRRKLLEANRRAAGLPEPPGGREASRLLEQEWSEIVTAAALTEGQSEVVELRLSGYTFEQIGDRRGHSKQGAQNIFLQAAKKLARAWFEYPYRGLSQVYREEVRRGAPRRR